VTLVRGFKAQAERDAVLFRKELGLQPEEPLDLRRLADHLRVRIVSGERLLDRKRFEEVEALQIGAFSAATFQVRGNRIIVTNPMASVGRLNSDVAHELAHIVLNHELSEIRQIAGVPFRTCNPDEEEQATALGGTLLLPRPLLLAAVHQGLTKPEAVASRFRVSSRMASYRLHSTGVLAQARRGRPTT